ncbi:hypothetical protein EYD10_12487 [Varanus komodoensis]|nr:uncharacterized protein C9orf43 homolog isoform X2 [Varanus komodoensis]KAF7241064.1 hypothetical protein EYD10_12487 [Varanus komodoensis]
MATVDASQWDETVCNMIACQHPPCWEAMRRIESGHPRILLGALDSSGRELPESENGLPTLKVFNLPLNYSERGRIRSAASFGSISKTISSIKDVKSYFSNSTLNDTVLHPFFVMSSERNPFPGLNSRMESQTPHFSPISFNCLRQTEKIQVTDLGEFAVHKLGCQPAYGNVIVRWVPDKRHRLPRPEKPGEVPPAHRTCVKDLALESLLSFKEKKEVKRKKSNKVPTGGQPYLFHLRRSQKVSASTSSLVGKERNPETSPVQKGQFAPCRLHLVPVVSPQNGSTINLENGRGMLSENKEKLAPPFTVQKAPNLYQIRTKIPTKERASRSPSKVTFALQGSGFFQHATPDLALRLDAAGEQCRKLREVLPEKSQQLQEVSATADPRPLLPIMPGARRRSSVRFVECRSNAATEQMAGYENVVPRMQQSESRYNQYCKQLASQREATLAQTRALSAAGRELWPEEATQSHPEETFLPPLGFLNPPPPPPSPLIPENSDNPSLELT